MEKCKRFLLEFEDGAFMEDDEDEEEDGIGGIPGRKKYKVFVQRVRRGRRGGREGGREGGRKQDGSENENVTAGPLKLGNFLLRA